MILYLPTVLSPGSRRSSQSTITHSFSLWVALCFWSCSLAVSLSLVILTFQTKHGCLNLMKHPLVISLLDYKWKKFGRYIFFGNLLIYLIFLAFLTAFGLVVLSPVERPCKHILYKIIMCVWVQLYRLVVFMATTIPWMAVYEFVIWLPRILLSFTCSLQRVDVCKNIMFR